MSQQRKSHLLVLMKKEKERTILKLSLDALRARYKRQIHLIESVLLKRKQMYNLLINHPTQVRTKKLFALDNKIHKDKTLLQDMERRLLLKEEQYLILSNSCR